MQNNSLSLEVLVSFVTKLYEMEPKPEGCIIIRDEEDRYKVQWHFGNMRDSREASFTFITSVPIRLMRERVERALEGFGCKLSYIRPYERKREYFGVINHQEANRS